jgi:tRNA (guanosine-2'-O-)-methyltransferase
MASKTVFFAPLMERALKQELIRHLGAFMSPQRLSRFDKVISERTAHLRIVLENMYQAHNASAILRSCESFGVQHVHFIENNNRMRISDDVAMGSSNWLSIHRHKSSQNNTSETIAGLRDLGYRIVATSPHKNEIAISELNVDNKLALFFGTEIDGISNELIAEADEFVSLPMYGFTESFNVSVCAALCMYELCGRMRKNVPLYNLEEEEKEDIYLAWLKTSVEHSEEIIKRYLNDKKI